MIKKKLKGFTLVELVAILTIITIFSGVIVSDYTSFVNSNRLKSAKLEITELRDRLTYHNITNKNVDYAIKNGVLYISKNSTTLVDDDYLQEIVEDQYQDILVCEGSEIKTISINSEANKITYTYEKDGIRITATWDMIQDIVSAEQTSL